MGFGTCASERRLPNRQDNGFICIKPDGATRLVDIADPSKAESLFTAKDGNAISMDWSGMPMAAVNNSRWQRRHQC